MGRARGQQWQAGRNAALPQVTFLTSNQITCLNARVMAETYAMDRDRAEREKERASGATGIPFSHATSVQGNPMRAGEWRSSSRYHRHCTQEEAGWSDRVPSY